MKTYANTIMGEGIPTTDIGNEGEYFTDFLTSLIYGPKANGEWGQGVTFYQFKDQTAEVPAEEIQPDQSEELTALQKLEKKIAELEEDGSEVYKAALDALKDERDKLVADAKAKAAQAQNTVQEAIEDVEEGAKDVEQASQSFWQKHGRSITDGAKVFFAAATAIELFVLIFKH